MAHPFSGSRQTKVEHARVGHITKGYASGGRVKHSDEAEDRKLIKKMLAEEEAKEKKVEGRAAGGRLDRVSRRRGGRMKHKGKSGKTNVNVIVAPQHHPAGDSLPAAPMAAVPRPPMPVVPPAGVGGPPPGGPPMAGAPGLPPGLPPRPMMPPPGALPPGGPGLPPPGAMPIRRRGGRSYAKGGAVKSGPAFEEGRKNGTQVTHSPNKGDGPNVGRGRVVTYKRGGAVESNLSHTIKDGMGPDLGGGGGGARARLEKASRAEKLYAKPRGANA